MSESAGLERTDDFDPLAPETFDSPYAVYADLRARCPLAYSSAHGGFWALTRYEDVKAAVNDAGRFITSLINVVPNMSLGSRRPPFAKDPPEHTPYRRALDRTLRASRIEQVSPAIRAHVKREVARLVAAGEGDVSQDLATRIPAWTAVEWLNLRPEEADLLAHVARLYNIAWRLKDRDAVAATSERLFEVARGVVEDRKRNPRDPATDPASALLIEETPEGPIPEEYVLQTVRQVLVVGLMAPPPLFGSICVHLSRDQDLQERLRADPSLIGPAIEEFLRLYTPYRGFARTVTEPVTMYGRTIEPGEPVTMVYAAANRDETVFEAPDSFILGRPNINQHMAFGHGPHRCAGMALARLEFRFMLEEMLAQSSRFELAGELEMTSLPELGPVSTPIRFFPR